MPNIEISVGELLDKLSILKIKKEKISDSSKLDYINSEFKMLSQKSFSFLQEKEIEDIFEDLYSTNAELWEIEDRLRIFESLNKFDSEFIELARKVYKINDYRFSLKNKINIMLNSFLKEQKNHDMR